MTSNLENKISVITGAGRGIGREIAKRFSQEGSLVICIAKTKKEINE